MPSMHGLSHSFAHSSEHGIHYDDPSHSSETKPSGGGEGGHIPLKVTPEQNPFTSAASGLPTDSTPKKSMLQKVTSPTKQGDYVVDTKAPADANGSRPVYRRENDDIGTLKPTQERAIPDGKGGWKMVSDADAAKPANAPALPPAAKIDPKQLGPLNDKGVYPGGDGNSYVRVGDDHYRVSYDQSLKSWMVVDPSRPHDFSRSVPVKLDGKGGVEKVLPKAGLKGGMDDGQRPGSSKQSSSQGYRMTPHDERDKEHVEVHVNWGRHDPRGPVPVSAREVRIPDPNFENKWQDSTGIKPGKSWVKSGQHGLEPYTPKPGERPKWDILVDTKDPQGKVTTEWKYYHGSLGSDDKKGGSST
ncbi:hypothetical protein [Dyella nitratireducens]|uniref:Uncharacterized protein n=1 Tax=Dyella nitratireducens TaxID=1849580 RepID=A0ABQ1GSP6_9GAMM|nr:hypothetical protein [Dyella nitratireducens]GGA49641.1 hypothetical protein GCM10010981_43630 [Dyella nitratireducens]GLQ42478.1 hypothetical protein GCM10007902_23280 [Dyella nitratireducens]